MKQLRGPFPLTPEALAARIAAQFAAFALGYTSGDGRFCTTVVGRANGNLRERLARHLGTEREFRYLPLTSDADAFDVECRLFHSLAPLKTRLHPARPPGTSLTCPVCGGCGATRAIDSGLHSSIDRATLETKRSPGPRMLAFVVQQ